jgi:enoyl reductase-like protein
VTPDRRVAAGLVEDALGEVFEPALVSRLREDSPLSVLGMSPADAVSVADAIAAAAGRAGLSCALDDADFITEEDLTVADLVEAIMRALDEEATP